MRVTHYERMHAWEWDDDDARGREGPIESGYTFHSHLFPPSLSQSVTVATKPIGWLRV